MDPWDDSGKVDAAEKGAGTPEMDPWDDSSKLYAALSSDVAPAAQNGVEGTDWITTPLTAGELPATLNGVAYGDDWLTANLGTGMPPATGNALAYDVPVMGPLSSGVVPLTRNAVAYPDVVMPSLISGVPPAARNGVSYTDLVVVHLGAGVPPAAQNAVAYPDGQPTVTTAPGTGAVSYNIGESEGAADFGFEHAHPTRAAPAATEQGGGYYNSGISIPFAVQVFADENRGGAVAGAFTERVRRGLPVLGHAVASLAVIGLTAGGAATPATAFGLFAMLLGGVSLVTVRVLRA